MESTTTRTERDARSARSELVLHALEGVLEEQFEEVGREARLAAFKDAAGECDAQAEAIEENTRDGDYDGNSVLLQKMAAQLQAYRDMAEHLRELGATPRPRVQVAAVSYVERPDGRVLCVWNAELGGWTLPGGKVEPGESVEAAQARELREETGLETVSRVPRYAGPSAGGDAAHCVAFVVTAYRGEAGEREADRPVGWLTREDLLRHSPFADFYRRLFEIHPVGSPASSARSPDGLVEDPSRPLGMGAASSACSPSSSVGVPGRLLGAPVRVVASPCCCEIHDSATEGLPRLVATRSRPNHHLLVCSACYDRTWGEAERERLQVTP